MLLVFITGIDKTGNFGGCVTVSVVNPLLHSGGCDVDGGLVHVPEDCHCVCPDHHTLHCYCVSYLLG